MSLLEQLQSDVKDAMKARDSERVQNLRLFVNAVQNEAKAKLRDLEDGEVISVLQREKKKRVEAAEAFEAGGHPDRAAAEREQADAIALGHRARLVGTTDEVLVETRAASGYGGGAGVLLTDDHVAATGADGLHPTGYTRDYSPVRFVDLPQHVADGDLVAVRLESLDDATGTLVARYEATLGG
jgi:hypothetical protein